MTDLRDDGKAGFIRDVEDMIDAADLEQDHEPMCECVCHCGIDGKKTYLADELYDLAKAHFASLYGKSG